MIFKPNKVYLLKSLYNKTLVLYNSEELVIIFHSLYCVCINTLFLCIPNHWRYIINVVDVYQDYWLQVCEHHKSDLLPTSKQEVIFLTYYFVNLNFNYYCSHCLYQTLYRFVASAHNSPLLELGPVPIQNSDCAVGGRFCLLIPSWPDEFSFSIQWCDMLKLP